MFSAKPVLIVGGATALSRILGFVRDILIAAALGTGAVADAFFVAFRLPNLLRRLLGEGALNAAFVPIMARIRAGRGEEAANAFARRAMTAAAVGLTGFALIGELIAPALVGALAPGFRDDPAKFALAVDYTRLAFPFLAFAALSALLAATLNAQKRFASAALAPVIVNIVLVGLLLWLAWRGPSQEATARALALGVSAAGLAQAAWLILSVRLSPVGWPFGRLGWSPDLSRLALYALPGVIAGGATQLAIVAATQVASVTPGGVSWLYYADRVYQLPLGFVAVAMGTVLLPDIAEKVRAGDAPAERETLNQACGFALLLAVPAAAGMAALATPIVTTLFERAAFGPSDTAATAGVLAWLALGLPGAVLGKVLAQPFFARERPAAPLFAALGVVAGTFAGGWLLLDRMGVAGVALAMAVSTTAQALALGILLIRGGVWRPDLRLILDAARIGAASAVMAGTALWLAGLAAPWLTAQTSFAVKGPAILGVCLAGGLIYGLVAAGLGVSDLARLLRRGDDPPSREAH